MLTRLEFTNFKSWKEASIDLAPLTILFGSNSSGKSSIIQFLLMLKQTKDSADRSIALDLGGGPNSLVDLGSFRDVAHSHDEDGEINWEIEWALNDELRLADPSGKRSEALFKGKSISISSGARLRNKTVSTTGLEYRFSNHQFSLKREANSANFSMEASGPSGFRFTRNLGRAWDLPGPIRSYAFPDQAKTYYQNAQFLSDFESAYVEQFNNILHLGPLRDVPRRQYTWAGSSPADVGERGERTIDAILAATARGITRNRRPKAHLKPFQEVIAYWLKEMGLIHEFRVEEVREGTGLYQVKVKSANSSVETLITDVGFGISQFLPVLVLLYFVPERSTVVLEQPEIHLHPAVQSALADLIVSVIKTRNLQVVVESHSEHLLQRLLRRVAEGGDSPYPSIHLDDMKIYFCRSVGNHSEIEPLKVNLFGGIENWPRDFFGDQIGDVFARDEAALRRRISNK